MSLTLFADVDAGTLAPLPVVFTVEPRPSKCKECGMEFRDAWGFRRSRVVSICETCFEVAEEENFIDLRDTDHLTEEEFFVRFG